VLGLHNGSDRVDGVATLELNGEVMFGQCDARIFLLSLQGKLEKRMKTCGSWLVSHVKSRNEMGTIGGGLVRWEIGSVGKAGLTGPADASGR
jgi:hypothetical protein